MARRQPRSTNWDPQADWYDARHGVGGDDLHATVVLPAVLSRLKLKPEQRVLDCCCGQGVLGRQLAAQGAKVIGVDAAESLIASATERAGPGEDYRVGDAHDLGAVLGDETFDHAAVVLALQDLDPIADVLQGLATHVTAGGRLVIVLVHPCFRPVRRSTWGWDDRKAVQYRRVEAYLQPYQERLQTHPGRGGGPESTAFHRPLSAYLNALGRAGFAVVGADELCSPRRGSDGRKAAAEDRALREIPMFLILTAQRL